MDKILVTGGSHAELPLIESLHDLGYYVITTGNNHDGLGHKQADLYVEGDFSDKNFVLSLAQKYRVKGIVSGCNDFAYLSTAYACKELGLPGHDDPETAETIHHKNLFRKLLKESDLPVPENIIIKDDSDLISACKFLGFPLLIKPIDLTGGKGVKICNNYSETVSAYNSAITATRENFVIAEQMINGTNHGVSVLIKNGNTVFSFFDNEEYYLNKYLVSGANTPAYISDSIKNNIITQINTIAKKLCLKDGLFHCQCIITDNEQAYLIDPCRRSPGDLYIKLVEYASGIKYSEAIVKAELGLDFSNNVSNNVNKANCIARECIMTDHTGCFKSIIFDDSIEKYIIDKLIWAKENEPIDDFLKYKAGIVFFKFPDSEIMKESLNNLYSKIKILT